MTAGATAARPGNQAGDQAGTRNALQGSVCANMGRGETSHVCVCVRVVCVRVPMVTACSLCTA